MHVHGSKGPCMRCVESAANAAHNMQMPYHAFHPGQTCLPNQSQTAKQRPIPCQPAKTLPPWPFGMTPGRRPQYQECMTPTLSLVKPDIVDGCHMARLHHSTLPSITTSPNTQSSQHACTAVGKRPYQPDINPHCPTKHQHPDRIQDNLVYKWAPCPISTQKHQPTAQLVCLA
jgi:hypothetical protein